MKTLVFFDFDGTLTTNDTLFGIIAYILGPVHTLRVFLLFLPTFFRYKIGLLKNDEAKAVLFARAFGGMPYGQFAELCKRYSLQQVPKVVKQRMLSILQEHDRQGHECIIVSASVVEWIEPWALQNGFTKVLATQAAVQENRLTGAFASANCHGEEKVKRIDDYLKDRGLDRADCHVVAYGDSSGDDVMLAWADQGNRVKGQIIEPCNQVRNSHA